MAGILRDLYDSLKRLFGDNVQTREIKEVESWDGSASRFETSEDYCNACLLNLNAQAGIEDAADWTQDNCKLPVREPGDGASVYVKQALGPAAAALAGGRTPMVKPEGVEDADWQAALKAAAGELISAYEQADEIAPASVYAVAGQEAPEAARALASYDVMNALYFALEMNEEREANLLDVYWDNDAIYAIASSQGKLYRVAFTVNGADVTLGEWQEVQHEFTPTAERSAFTVKRQTDGRYRWFSRSCTAVLNRVGEIDSTQLFDQFEARLEEYGYPYRTFYHSGPAYRTGQADFVARDGYVLVTSGLYDDTPLAQLEIKARQANPDYWGESIGYQPLSREMLTVGEIDIPVYVDGYMIEVSTLPERQAAALFTQTMQQEVQRMLTGKALQAFMKLAADAGMSDTDAQAWLEANIDATNRQITQTGMITRDGEAEAEAEPKTAPEAAAVTPVEVDEVQRIGQLLEAQQGVIRELVDQMTSFVGDVNTRLAALEDKATRQRQAYLDDLPELPAVNIWRPKQARAADDGDAPTETAAQRATRILQEKKQNAS